MARPTGVCSRVEVLRSRWSAVRGWTETAEAVVTPNGQFSPAQRSCLATGAHECGADPSDGLSKVRHDLGGRDAGRVRPDWIHPRTVQSASTSRDQRDSHTVLAHVRAAGPP